MPRKAAAWANVIAFIFTLVASVTFFATETFGFAWIYLCLCIVTFTAYGLFLLVHWRRAGSGRLSFREASDAYFTRYFDHGVVIGLISTVRWVYIPFVPSNLILLSNQWLDRSIAVERSIFIESKGQNSGSRGLVTYSAYFRIGPQSPYDNVKVPRSTFDLIAPNRSHVVLLMRSGAFGFPWTAKPPKWSNLAPEPQSRSNAH